MYRKMFLSNFLLYYVACPLHVFMVFLPIIIVIIENYLLCVEWLLNSKPEIKELQVIIEVPGLGVLT